MKFDFTKMHGAGNDFIVAFDTSEKWPRLTDTIKTLCNRKRGIGADGLILLSHNSDKKIPFKMVYFNSDGSVAEMCGNGLRCAALFCYNNLDSGKQLKIMTASGPLEASILPKNTVKVKIPIKGDFKKINIDGDEMYFGNTGVPHLVKPVKDINKVNVLTEGGKLRHHKLFAPAGTNVMTIGESSKGDTSGVSLYFQKEIELIRMALEENRWNRAKTAEALGMNPSTLWRKIKKYRL